MNFDNFESFIDQKILARGYDYYKNGCVRSVEETAAHVFEAKVEGAELYTVEVELNDKADIIDTRCDCPYDLGEYCKHRVAVFLVLRDMKNNISGNITDISCNGKGSESVLKSHVPNKSKAPDIEKVLSERTKAELIDFLLDIASEYKEIKQRIALDFSDGNEEDELLQSIELIRTFIKNNSDRHGFIAYRDTYEAIRGAELVLDKARLALGQNKNMHALDLALCVIHEMLDLLESADDSDGVVGGAIEESLALINEVIEDEEMNPFHKESLLNKLMKETANSRYEDWSDWKLELLSSCSVLADTPILRNKLEEYLVSMVRNEKGDSWSINYFAERVNLIRYQLVEQFDGPEKAREFIEQNLRYSDFRKMALESALKAKDYDLVIKLALDGEEQDQSSCGLVDGWKKYRYKAFQLSGKLDEQRGLAIDFILDGSFEYYKELKSTYDSREWRSVYPQVILMLENQKKTYQAVYSRILTEEGEKQKLLEYVKGKPSLIKDYYQHLIPEYQEEVYALFLHYIEQTAARADKRKDYQGVCAIIRNLKKAGGKEQALEIKQKLLNKYANKPAFRDELTRV